MARLTEITSNGFAPKYERETQTNYYDLVSKLGKLEDIEEELGIDLITLFKALTQGAWFVDSRTKKKFFAMCSLCSKFDGEFLCAQEEMKFNRFIVLDQLFGFGYELKGYGKTRALTKEELE